MGIIHISPCPNTQRIVSFSYLECKENGIDTILITTKPQADGKKLDMWEIADTLPKAHCYASFASRMTQTQKGRMRYEKSYVKGRIDD